MQNKTPYFGEIVAETARRVAAAGYNPATAPDIAAIVVDGVLDWQRRNLPSVEAGSPAQAADPEHLRRLALDLSVSGRVVTESGDPAVLAIVDQAAYALRSAAAMIEVASDFSSLLDRDGPQPVLPAALADAAEFFRDSARRSDFDLSMIDWSKIEDMKSFLVEAIGAVQTANRDRCSAADLLEVAARISPPDALATAAAMAELDIARLDAERRAEDAERVVGLWKNLQPDIDEVLESRGPGFTREVQIMRDIAERQQECPDGELRVYVASRASLPERPAMWRALRDGGVNIVSSWIDEAGPGETSNLSELWLRIEREVKASDVVILYAETDDFPLKGAYHEAAFAMASGIPVIVVLPGVDLDPRSYRPIGSWICHPGVSRVDTIVDALDLAVQKTGKDIRRRFNREADLPHATEMPSM